MRVYVLHPHTNFEVLRPSIPICVCVSRPVTLTFDLLNLKLVRNVARVMGTQLLLILVIRFRFVGHWANTAQTDYMTL